MSDLLDRHEASLGIKKFDLLIDWGWFYFITRPMFWLIDFIKPHHRQFRHRHSVRHRLVKIAFFPLANSLLHVDGEMKKLQPQMESDAGALQGRSRKQQQEMMALYKREKINPVAGCLPMVIQIPVFFALYKVLLSRSRCGRRRSSAGSGILSQPDPTNIFNLFGLVPWDPTHMPLIGSFLRLGIWPIIMGLSMWIQMKINPDAARSGAEADVRLHADHLHLHARRRSRRAS